MRNMVARIFVPLGFLFIAWALASPAQAQPPDTYIWLDFDDDGSPWTLRTSLPEGVTSATVKFVLEVGTTPIPPVIAYGRFTEGCCNGPESDAHYGTYVDAQSVTFDPIYVIDFFLEFATCTFCCPWGLGLVIASDAPVVTGQRYFIGQAAWNAYCDVPGPCTPPTDFSYYFQELGGEGHMYFYCPPTAVQDRSWGRIKILFR
ncbi:MAG: hypothetical protein FJY88_04395 [Candidatus Eisenbacteria bacterium]|nr:hypothetical protein [Candidatus Eisenbacteria bacterium]